MIQRVAKRPTVVPTARIAERFLSKRRTCTRSTAANGTRTDSPGQRSSAKGLRTIDETTRSTELALDAATLPSNRDALGPTALVSIAEPESLSDTAARSPDLRSDGRALRYSKQPANSTRRPTAIRRRTFTGRDTLRRSHPTSHSQDRSRCESAVAWDP
jgi:hypothetical protein